MISYVTVSERKRERERAVMDLYAYIIVPRKINQRISQNSLYPLSKGKIDMTHGNHLFIITKLV